MPRLWADSPRSLRAHSRIVDVLSSKAAHASGFADQSHMTRCFVRSFGYTPGRYAQPAR